MRSSPCAGAFPSDSRVPLRRPGPQTPDKPIEVHSSASQSTPFGARWLFFRIRECKERKNCRYGACFELGNLSGRTGVRTRRISTAPSLSLFGSLAASPPPFTPRRDKGNCPLSLRDEESALPSLAGAGGLAFIRACRSRRGHGRLFMMCRAVRTGSRRGAVRAWDFQLLAQHSFELLADVRILLQKDSRVFATLAHALAAEADPRTGLLQHSFLDAQIDQVALARDSFAVQNIELRFAKRRRHLVLHHFRARPRTDHLVAFLDRLDPANVHTHR